VSELLPDAYIRHDDLCVLLRGMESEDIIAAIKAGKFGRRGPGALGPFREGKFFWVPVRGVNEFIAARTVFEESGELKAIHTRTALPMSVFGSAS